MASRRSSLWALAGLLAVATGPAYSADDGYKDVFSSVATAVGLMTPDPAPEIDYSERAPLVLPPKMELPPPSAEIAHPASWPTDPDVARRNKAAQEGRAPSENLLGNRRTLMSRDDQVRGRGGVASDTSYRADRCGKDGNARGCLVESPDHLKAESEYYAANNPEGSSKTELKPGEEPDRVYLTQPPKGYLAPTKVVKVTTEAPRVYHDEANPAAALVYKAKPDDE